MPLQNELATLSTYSDHRVLPNATHEALINDERNASLSTQAIRDVTQAVRGAKPLGSIA